MHYYNPYSAGAVPDASRRIYDEMRKSMDTLEHAAELTDEGDYKLELNHLCLVADEIYVILVKYFIKYLIKANQSFILYCRISQDSSSASLVLVSKFSEI